MKIVAEDNLSELTKVKLTNLDKILYPKNKVTKAQVIEYYVKMAPTMLPIIADRPLVLTRYPDGIEGDKFSFLKKTLPKALPNGLKQKRFTHQHPNETSTTSSAMT